jgi:hypothetical protein
VVIDKANAPPRFSALDIVRTVFRPNLIYFKFLRAFTENIRWQCGIVPWGSFAWERDTLESEVKISYSACFVQRHLEGHCHAPANQHLGPSVPRVTAVLF